MRERGCGCKEKVVSLRGILRGFIYLYEGSDVGQEGMTSRHVRETSVRWNLWVSANAAGISILHRHTTSLN